MQVLAAKEFLGGNLRYCEHAEMAMDPAKHDSEIDSATTISEERELDIYNALFAGRKIEAIKLHREATGCGLKDSKDFIDALEEQLRAESPEKFARPAKQGCAPMILLACGVGMAAMCCGPFRP
jgi:ribosomal protein L7/L12